MCVFVCVRLRGWALIAGVCEASFIYYHHRRSFSPVAVVSEHPLLCVCVCVPLSISTTNRSAVRLLVVLAVWA